jgi:excisionase family DNA binding protein
MPNATVTDVQALPAVLTVEQVKQILGISRVKTYELVHTAGFPTIRIGRAIRIPREAFLRWMDGQKGQE